MRRWKAKRKGHNSFPNTFEGMLAHRDCSDRECVMGLSKKLMISILDRIVANEGEMDYLHQLIKEELQ